jgi:hypothetical protein
MIQICQDGTGRCIVCMRILLRKPLASLAFRVVSKSDLPKECLTRYKAAHVRDFCCLEVQSTFRDDHQTKSAHCANRHVFAADCRKTHAVVTFLTFQPLVVKFLAVVKAMKNQDLQVRIQSYPIV